MHGVRVAAFGGVHIPQQIFQARRFDIQMLGLAGQDGAQQTAHLFAELGVAPRLGGLSLERSELLFDFDQNVVHAREIDLGGLEFGLGQPPLGLVHGDAGSLFDDGAAVHGLGIQDLTDAALLDDGVAIRTQPHAHEDFLDVAQAGHTAVDEVFALAGAIQAATHDHFTRAEGDGRLFGGAFLAVFPVSGVTHRGFAGGDVEGCAARLRNHRRVTRSAGFGNELLCAIDDFGDRLGEFGIHQREGHFGQTQGRALGGAIEDAIRHALGAEHLVALLAQDPGDGVDDVGLAAAIGADNAGDPDAAEGDRRLLEEGFEAQQLNFTEF